MMNRLASWETLQASSGKPWLVQISMFLLLPVCFLCGLLPLGRSLGQDAEAGNARAIARRSAYLVPVGLPLVGERDTEVRRQLRKIIDTESGSELRPVVVLQFEAAPMEELAGEKDNGGMRTRGSQFERCLSLARFLTSPAAAPIRLVAYLPDSVEGHAVLPVLACEEIYAAPQAELGRAAIDEPNETTVEAAYRDIVERRGTLPAEAVVAMLDPQSEVYEVELADSTTAVIDRAELDRLRNSGSIIQEKTLWQGGSLASFTGSQMRTARWIAGVVDSDADIAASMNLGALRTISQLPREWNGVSISLDGELSQSRVNQIIRSLNERIDEETNLVVLRIGTVDSDFQQASRLASFLADLREREVYTLGIAANDVNGPIGLALVACQEAVLIGGATLNADSRQVVDTTDDSIQRFLGDFASRSARPISLLSAVVDSQVTVKQFVHQQTGRRNIFASWQIEQQADADQWLARNTLITDGTVAQDVALMYKLVDSVDETEVVALSRLGLEELPEELQTPWIDSMVQLLLAQGWLPRLLLMIGFFALMAELGNPGLGAGGFLSAVCFTGFFWVEGLNGNVEALEVILFVGGLLALALELFVVPGFGIFGIGGLLMVFVSVILASQTFVWPTNSAQLGEIASNMFWTACLALGGMVGLLFMHKQVERLPMFRWVTLAPDDALDLDDRESLTHREHLVGQQGLTTTRLNPSGKAQFGNDIVSVVGTGKMIDAGVPISVVEVRGNLVLVEES